MWCKLWRFLLNTFTDVVDAVAYALDTLGDVAVDLLTDLGDGLGSAIGSIFGGSNLLIWLGVGVFAYMLLTKEDSEGNGTIHNLTNPNYNRENVST